MPRDTAATTGDPGGSSVVRAAGLTKQFGRFRALKNVELELNTGEFLTVFGRNGAGKTTFLRIAATISHSYSGKIEIFGKDAAGADAAIRNRIGFVSHESFLYGDLSVADNLNFYARLYQLENAAQRVAQMIEQVDLATKTKSPVRALSRGMKQRLSLARAFLHNPSLLLLDEPFTGLDERAADILHDMLAGFRDRGGAVIMATHNSERGWRHADRVAILEKGSVAYNSAVKDTTFEAFREQYRDILTH